MASVRSVDLVILPGRDKYNRGLARLYVGLGKTETRPSLVHQIKKCPAEAGAIPSLRTWAAVS